MTIVGLIVLLIILGIVFGRKKELKKFYKVKCDHCGYKYTYNELSYYDFRNNGKICENCGECINK